MDQNQDMLEPVVECADIGIKIKDEDPLSIYHGYDEPILKNINQGGPSQSIKQEEPEVTTSVYQHNKVNTNREPRIVLTPVSLQTQNATSTSNAPKNAHNISNRTMKTHRSAQVESKSYERILYQNKLQKYDKLIKKKNRQVKNLKTRNNRLKANNEKLKELLKKYKQKQVISESVLKDIAKNSKLANMLLSHIMSNVDE